MISGHFQGRVLAMISKLVSPASILEIGTYTGYSALCLSEGLQKDGILHTIDHNEELYDFQRKYFDRSAYKDQIKQYVGNAMDLIKEIPVHLTWSLSMLINQIIPIISMPLSTI